MRQSSPPLCSCKSQPTSQVHNRKFTSAYFCSSPQMEGIMFTGCCLNKWKFIDHISTFSWSGEDSDDRNPHFQPGLAALTAARLSAGEMKDNSSEEERQVLLSSHPIPIHPPQHRRINNLSPLAVMSSCFFTSIFALELQRNGSKHSVYVLYTVQCM